jgi:hypothetical protein
VSDISPCHLVTVTAAKRGAGEARWLLTFLTRYCQSCQKSAVPFVRSNSRGSTNRSRDGSIWEIRTGADQISARDHLAAICCRQKSDKSPCACEIQNRCVDCLLFKVGPADSNIHRTPRAPGAFVRAAVMESLTSPQPSRSHAPAPVPLQRVYGVPRSARAARVQPARLWGPHQACLLQPVASP